MKRRIFRLALVAVATAAVLGVVAGQALALDSTPSVTIENRPVFVQPPDLVWWQNTLYPSAQFSVETTSPWVDGYLYTLDHAPGAIPFLPTPIGQAVTAFAPVQWAGQDSSGNNTVWHPLFGGTLDMAGWAAAQVAPYADPAVQVPGEGRWWIHVRSTSATDTSSPPMSPIAEGAFGIDVTPPSAVTGLQPVDGQPSAWREYSRRDFVWNHPSDYFYDELSGEAQWGIRVNGGSWFDWRIVNLAGYPFGFASVEELKNGRNKIEVTNVDYALNRSQATVIYANVDNDTPAASISSGDSFGKSAVFSVDARDAAGISSVVFKVDGQTIGTDTTKPYSMAYNTSGLSNFGSHTLQVVATDMVGGMPPARLVPHVATASKSFYVDNIAPSITSIYDTPDPFYPIVRDGYKDNLKVGFKLSERSYSRLQIFSGSTKIREIAGWRSAGSQNFVWDGKNSSDVRKIGTFYYRIVATDTAGNTTYSSKRTAVATTGYFVVQDSNNSAHVVRR